MVSFEVPEDSSSDSSGSPPPTPPRINKSAGTPKENGKAKNKGSTRLRGSDKRRYRPGIPAPRRTSMSPILEESSHVKSSRSSAQIHRSRLRRKQNGPSGVSTDAVNRSRRSVSPSPPPLCSPRKIAAYRVHKRDIYTLPSKTKSKSYDIKSKRYIVIRNVPRSNTASWKEIRATRKIYRYPGLMRMLAFEGYGVEEEGKGKTVPSRWSAPGLLREIIERPKRTYWDYGDYGTLSQLLDQHPNGLPEGLVWHVMLSLLKTALYLHDGYAWNEKQEWEEDWRQGVLNSSVLNTQMQYQPACNDPRYQREQEHAENSEVGPYYPAYCGPDPKVSAIVEPGKNASPIQAAKDGIDKWQPIIHNMINPWNVHFYSHDEEDDHRNKDNGNDEDDDEVLDIAGEIFPHVKLGNLSRATVLPPGDYEVTAEDFPALPRALETNFQAPEVMWGSYGHPPQRTKSDLWSVAAVAVTMMGGVPSNIKHRDDGTGRAVPLPSDAAFYLETARMISKGRQWGWTASDLDKQHPGRYSLELRLLLERLLKLAPKQRPTTMEAVEWATTYYYHWFHREADALERFYEPLDKPEKPQTPTKGHLKDPRRKLAKPEIRLRDMVFRVGTNMTLEANSPVSTPSPHKAAFTLEEIAQRRELTNRAGGRYDMVEFPVPDTEMDSETEAAEVEMDNARTLQRLEDELQPVSPLPAVRFGGPVRINEGGGDGMDRLPRPPRPLAPRRRFL